jgi:ankyrin repeat protein
MGINLGTAGTFDARRGQAPTASHEKKRRFFAFTLRQLLLLCALSCVLLGIVTPRIRRTLRGWELQQDIDQRETVRVAIAADLNTAVRTNNVALARHALEAGADPNLDPRENLLCSCIVNGRDEIMELLLKFGADADLPICGSPPLFVAARCNQPPEVRCKMIRLLVAAGVDPRRQSGHPSSNAMDIAFSVSDGRTGDLLREYGLPYGSREMVGFNRLDELKQAVEQNPGIIEERFQPSWAPPGEVTTLLAIAVDRGYREISLFLIESGAPLDTVAYHGFTLLHLAARGGDPEIIRVLAARGLDVNAINRNSDTPLSSIAWSDKPQAIAALLEAGSNINHHGFDGRTPLHWAALGNLEIVRMLLAAGADAALPDKEGTTPLDLARTRNPQSPEIAKVLEQAAASERAPLDD